MQLRYHGLAFPKSPSALLWQVTLNNHLLCNYHANETSSKVSYSSLPANWTSPREKSGADTVHQGKIMGLFIPGLLGIANR